MRLVILGYPFTNGTSTVASIFALNAKLQKVKDLNLPAGDFAIFGSGPLLVRGVIGEVNDIDIICRGAAWRYAQELGDIVHLDEYDIDIISIGDGHITLGKTWSYGEFDIDFIINTAELIDGLPFVRLEHVIAYKRIANRSKDRAHLRALQSTDFWPETDPVAK